MQFWRLASPEQFSHASLVQHHDHSLCAVAVGLAILAAGAMLPVTDRYRATRGRVRYAWLAAGSVAMGIGIWAMHFTAMLAFSLPVPIGYDAVTTALSVVPAIASSACCIVLLRSGPIGGRPLHSSAVCLAAGIGTMHYLGMEAMIVPAEMYYVPAWFFLSLMSAYGLACVGLAAYSRLARGERRSVVGTVVGASALGLAVSSMHFLAMRATYFQPGAETVLQPHGIAPTSLVIAIVLSTLVLIGLIVIGSLVDGRIASMAHSLHASELRFQRLAETTQAAIFTFERGLITYANPALSTITGLRERSLDGLSLEALFGEEFAAFAERFVASANSPGAAVHRQFQIESTGGVSRWLHFSLTRSDLDSAETGLGSAFDLTDQKRAELEMRRLAYKDHLTSLPNRAFFMQQLERHLAARTRSDDWPTSCVMLLDLDGFKAVNDTYGHLCGDRLLIEVAERLRALLRHVDTIARLGGDEFVVLLERVVEPLDSALVAERLVRELSEPYEVDGRRLEVDASIGVVELNDACTMPDRALHDADVALYRAKGEEGSCWVLFDEEMDASAKRLRDLSCELASAIREGELALEYQPIVCASDGRVLGLEALIRWRRTNGEQVSPEEFIPVAERSGMITEIDLWVLETAGEHLAELGAALDGGEEVYVSVNVAASTVADERYASTARSLCERHGFLPGQLRVELTERTVFVGAETGLAPLDALRAAGCRLMIDDFGTGYSCLAYLHRLPVDAVKVDRSFVADLHAGQSSLPVIRTIVALARSLGLSLVSEGIETREQADTLRELGVDQLQGYLFGRPEPFACVARRLARERAGDRREKAPRGEV